MRKVESASLAWRTHTPNPNSHTKLKLKPALSVVPVSQYLNFLNSHLMKKKQVSGQHSSFSVSSALEPQKNEVIYQRPDKESLIKQATISCF